MIMASNEKTIKSLNFELMNEADKDLVLERQFAEESGEVLRDLTTSRPLYDDDISYDYDEEFS